MRVREVLDVIRSRQGLRWLRQTLRLRLHSSRIGIGVRRDLLEHIPIPPPKIPLVVRQLEPDDDLSFIADEPGLSPRSAAERTVQRWLLASNLPPPAVAIDGDGKVCFMAWMLTAEDNDLIRARWGEMLPQLKPGEAVIEGPFTAESHRGLGVMHAYDAILTSARESGLTRRGWQQIWRSLSNDVRKWKRSFESCFCVCTRRSICCARLSSAR